MKRALFSFPNLVRKITEPYARSILAFCEKIKPVCRRFGKPFQEFRQPFVFSSQYFRAMGGYWRQTHDTFFRNLSSELQTFPFIPFHPFNKPARRKKQSLHDKMQNGCANESTFLFYFAGLFKRGPGPVAQLDRASRRQVGKVFVRIQTGSQVRKYWSRSSVG